MEPSDPVPAAFLAELLQLTERRIQQLVREGVLVREGRGKYPLAENMHRWMAHLHGEEEEASLSPARRKAEAEARHWELKVAEAEGRVVALEDAVALNQELAALLQSRVLQIPNSWSPEVVGIRNRKEAVVRLRPLTGRLLSELRSTSDELTGDSNGGPAEE